MKIRPVVYYVQYNRGCAVQARHIFSTNEDVQYKGGTSSFEQGREHFSKILLNKSLSLLLPIYQLEMVSNQ